jgi:hypothetical protein
MVLLQRGVKDKDKDKEEEEEELILKRKLN